MSDTPTPAQAAEKAIREMPYFSDEIERLLTDDQVSELRQWARAYAESQLAEMRAEVERLETRAELAEQAHVCAAEERDHLRAVVKDLRADAMRYRWLRAKHSTCTAGDAMKPAVASVSFARFYLGSIGERPSLDAAIDDALAADGKDGAR